MSILSLTKITRTYIIALCLIALLTLGTFVTMYQVILTQSDSALLLNISGSQRWLSQKVALLGVDLVYGTKTSERDQVRVQLIDIIEQLQFNHQSLINSNPRVIFSRTLSPQMEKMYFSPPTNMHTRINRYLAEAFALAQDTEHLLTPDNPHFIYLLQNSSNLVNSLDQIVSLDQKESEAKVRRLQILEITSGVIILLTLAFTGLYIFRPLANTLLAERSQLESANQELSLLSSVDGLTEVANRRHFDHFLEQLWLLAIHSREPIALILCDIDHFKEYNDTFGHLQGDECLKQVALSLKNSLRRQGDFIARYGGEEFVVVLPNTDVKGALTVAETLRVSVESLAIPHPLSSVTPKVTISLGVAFGHADPKNHPKTLIKAADAALYKAKQFGRNNIILAKS